MAGSTRDSAALRAMLTDVRAKEGQQLMLAGAMQSSLFEEADLVDVVNPSTPSIRGYDRASCITA